jgi:hypothetical protein
MKKSFKSHLQLILGGFFLFLIMDVSTQCEQYVNFEYIDDDPGEETSEIRAMKEGAKEAMNAFLTGNSSEVLKVMSDSAAALYEELIGNIEAADFKALGEAFRERTLSVGSEVYAEFEYEADSKTFTIAFGRQGDGTWKMVRF